MMNNPMIQIDNLSVRFGTQTVLREVELEIQPLELFVLLGASGCGKSTLLRTIAGLDVPSSGTVRIEGRDVTRIPARDRGCAMSFQDGACYDHWTVERNIVSASNGDMSRCKELLERLDLNATLSRMPPQLSGGEKQRVSLARALVSPKPILLLDEPLAQLHPTLRVAAREVILDFHHRFHKTVIFVTHDLHEAIRLGTRVAILENGSLLCSGAPREMFDSPKQPAAANMFEYAISEPNEILNCFLPHKWRILKIGQHEFPCSSLTQWTASGRVVRCRWSGDGWEIQIRQETNAGNVPFSQDIVVTLSSGEARRLGIDDSLQASGRIPSEGEFITIAYQE